MKLPSKEHEELVARFSNELMRCGWLKVHNSYRRHGFKEGGVADGFFEKDGSLLALEVGYMPRGAFDDLMKAVRAGIFSLLSISFWGQVVLFDVNNCFFDDLGSSYDQPASVWFRKMNLL